MSPKRIQRRRIKGWRMPEGAVYVGRGSKWGNPYVLTKDCWGEYSVTLHGLDILRGPFVSLTAAGDDAIGRYQEALTKGWHGLDPSALPELRGKDLACWCPLDQPCHADVLLELANPKETP